MFSVLSTLCPLYGRRILLVSTVLGNCLCYFAVAFADTAWLAFAIRLLGGFASGNGSVVQAYIADVTPPEKRARRMSWLGAAFAIGLGSIARWRLQAATAAAMPG